MIGRLSTNVARAIASLSASLPCSLAFAPLLMATSASGQPITEPRPQTTEARFSWSGWYVGGHAGYTAGKANTTLSDPGAQSSTSSFGMLGGGLQVGYARLLGSRLLLGLEADASVPNFLENDDRVSLLGTSIGQVEEKVDMSGAVRARLGYALPHGLLYGIGGFAWSVGRFIHSLSDQAEDERWRVRPGWAIGAGFEIPVASRWTARLEYHYDHLGRATAAFAPTTSSASTVQMHSVVLGLNWQIRSPRAEVSRQGHVDSSPVEDRGGQDLETTAQGTEEHSSAKPDTTPWNIHGQTTFVGQGYPGFHSPYEGANSLSGTSQFRNTVSATAFLGLRLWRGGEIYFNPELMQGFGLSDVHGVAAFPNGEAQKSSFLVPRFNARTVVLEPNLRTRRRAGERRGRSQPARRQAERLAAHGHRSASSRSPTSSLSTPMPASRERRSSTGTSTAAAHTTGPWTSSAGPGALSSI